MDLVERQVEGVRTAFKAVSTSDKRRFISGGFNLDLSYITPKLIAMGLPGHGVPELWRHKVSEVAQFLEMHHANHYRVFNLGKSTHYVQHNKLHQHSVWYPWSSKQTPPLKLLIKLVSEIEEWLNSESENVAVVQCKEGRERCGVVICSYLLRNGVFVLPNDAVRYYAQMRSFRYEGIKTPSFIRYVNYMAISLHPPATQKTFLRRIEMYPVPDYAEGISPIVEVLDATKLPHNRIYYNKGYRTFHKLDHEMAVDVNMAVQDDIEIKIHNRYKILGVHSSFILFRLSLHTSYTYNKMEFTKDCLDAGDIAGPLKNNRISNTFRVIIYFTKSQFGPLVEHEFTAVVSKVESNPISTKIIPHQQPSSIPAQAEIGNPFHIAMPSLTPNPMPQTTSVTFNLPLSNTQQQDSGVEPMQQQQFSANPNINAATDNLARATNRLRKMGEAVERRLANIAHGSSAPTNYKGTNPFE